MKTASRLGHLQKVVEQAVTFESMDIGGNSGRNVTFLLGSGKIIVTHYGGTYGQRGT